MQPTDVLDPAAQALADQPTEEFDVVPAPEALDPDQGVDGPAEYGPPTFALELVFESDPTLVDAQAVWRKAAELIDSAKSKGLKLAAGQVYRSADSESESAERIAEALADLQQLEQHEAPQ